MTIETFKRWPQFDSKNDNILIAKGTHIWCHACQVARPLEEQSHDARYCKGCYDFLKGEAALLPGRKLSWMPKDTPTDVLSPVTKAQGIGEVVTKLCTGINTGLGSDKTTGNGIKHAGGRPLKEFWYSKRTAYRRRKKELQGIMPLPLMAGEGFNISHKNK